MWGAIKKYLKHVAIGESYVIDEFGNVILLEGNQRYTISAHCGSQIAAKRPCLFCRLVCGFIQKILGDVWPSLKHHCINAWLTEKIPPKNGVKK